MIKLILFILLFINVLHSQEVDKEQILINIKKFKSVLVEIGPDKYNKDYITKMNEIFIKRKYLELDIDLSDMVWNYKQGVDVFEQPKKVAKIANDKKHSLENSIKELQKDIDLLHIKYPKYKYSGLAMIMDFYFLFTNLNSFDTFIHHGMEKYQVPIAEKGISSYNLNLYYFSSGMEDIFNEIYTNYMKE